MGRGGCRRRGVWGDEKGLGEGEFSLQRRPAFAGLLRDLGECHSKEEPISHHLSGQRSPDGEVFELFDKCVQLFGLGGGVFPKADGFSSDFLEGRTPKLAAAKPVDEQLVHRQARQV